MKLPLDPGLLSRRVELEEATDVSDGAGGYRTEWKSLGSFWAHIESVASRPVEAAGRQSSEVRYDVVLRFNAAVRSGMRFSTGSSLMVVESVRDPDMTRRFTLCRVREDF